MGDAGQMRGTSRSEAPDAAEGRSAERAPGRRREDRIVGSSSATKRAVELAAMAARSELPVVVSGPPGSGRSFLARLIHGWGRRASGTLAVFPCAAWPGPVQARELFGNGASQPAQLGSIERAAGGTLVLEALESLAEGPLAALCAALQSGSYRPEGGGDPLPLRTRIVATVDRPLPAPPFGGAPLHQIELAPLAERPEDVLPLATHFLAAFAEETGVRPVGFTPEARAALIAEAWPGNVSELRERIRGAVQLCGDGAISAEALALAADGAEVPSFREAKRAFETRYVSGLLRRCGGNISRAARLAKKDRKDFYDVIRRTGVDPSQFRR